MFSRYKKFFILLILQTLNSIKYSSTYFAIEQCPGSDVPNIRHQVKYHEVSLIFYYTSWSEDSLDALQQYNDVAKHFGERAYFATIDCWHLACNCTKALTTSVGSGSPHKWPTLMLYYGLRGQLKIQYNGLFTFKDMVQFVESIMFPLERIERKAELNKMKLFTDAVVLGVFKTPNDLEYRNYLIAAIKWLEHDPIRSYRFTVSFANDIVERNLNDSNNEIMPNLYFLGHKGIKSFVDYSNLKWNSTNILRWLQGEFNNEYNLLHSYNTPIMIAQKLRKQPVLAILVNQPELFYSYMEKYVDASLPFTKEAKNCQQIRKQDLLMKSSLLSLKISKFLQQFPKFTNNNVCNFINDIILKNLQYYYEINYGLNDFFYTFSHSASTNIYRNYNREIKDILNFFHATKCIQIQNIELQSSLQIAVVKRLKAYLANEQQCCNSNRTLGVVLLDSKKYTDYLAGINIQVKSQSMANVFIADNEYENMHVMDDVFAMYNLMEFVKSFYRNDLTNYYIDKNMSYANPTSYDIQIKELNRIMFLNNLQFSYNQTLVVLIYSPDCALCGNIQHSFLQLSLVLRQVIDLKFMRINVLEQDLPWQFNMPFLPALIVFPEYHFSESRIFPMHLKPDVRNVFGFILNQLSPHQQVKLVLAACQSGSLPKSHLHSCWQFAKTILMQHIGKHLHYWQMFEAERSMIFERLRAFKDLSLDVQRNLKL